MWYIWPVRIVGRPGICISHTCVDLIFVPFGRLILSGFVVTYLLWTGIPSMMKIAVAPVSAIASDCSKTILLRSLGDVSCHAYFAP